MIGVQFKNRYNIHYCKLSKHSGIYLNYDQIWLNQDFIVTEKQQIKNQPTNKHRSSNFKIKNSVFNKN